LLRRFQNLANNITYAVAAGDRSCRQGANLAQGINKRYSGKRVSDCFSEKSNMPRGGHREGAGRKPGSKLTKSQLIAAEVREAGISPLELQLTTMRELWRRAHASREMDLGLAMQACQIAKDCAPYIHPRLAAIEAKVDTFGQLEVKLTAEERVRRARAAIVKAFAEVSSKDPKVDGAQEKAVDQQSSIAWDGHHGGHPGGAAETDGAARPIVREFAAPGELAANPEVSRLPILYRPPRPVGSGWGQ
jgi:hypothetical protein